MLMLRISPLKLLIICLFACATAVSASDGKDRGNSPWRFSTGVSVGNPTPMALVAGIGYKSVLVHVEGLGAHNGPNDFWCGIRGGLDWTFFWRHPFSIDAGFSGGYEYAEAPNKMHQAVNDANGAIILYPYNYVEVLDVSAEIRVHLFGFFTQIAYPIHYFMNHDEPDILWRIGYLVEF